MTPSRREAEPQWFKQRAVLTDDAVYLELGERFGSDGALVWIALKGAAKTQERLHRAHIDHSWRGLATAAFTTVDTVREVVGFLADLGAITLTREDHLTFAGDLPWWDSEQLSPDAKRKREERAQASAPVPACPVVSRTDPDPIEGEGDRDVEDKSSTKRAKIDQDILPDDLPDALAERVEPVLERLFKIHSLRGGNIPTRRGVGLKLAAYPLRDHVELADRCVYWATAGRGLHQNRKDWVAVYGTFLDGSPDASPQRPVASGHSTASDLGRFAEANGGVW